MFEHVSSTLLDLHINPVISMVGMTAHFLMNEQTEA